jgi:hypothetical protein
LKADAFALARQIGTDRVSADTALQTIIEKYPRGAG